MKTKLALFTLLLVAATACKSKEARREDHRARGVAFLAQGKTEEGAIELKNLLQLDPRDADAHRRLAEVYMKGGTARGQQAALLELRRSLDVEPNHVPSLVKVAQLSLNEGDIPKAKESAEAALHLDSKNAEALAVRGQARLAKGDDGGQTDLEDSIRAKPTVGAFQALAASHQNKGQTAEAGRALADGIKAIPNAPELHLMKGEMLFRQRKADEAEAAFRAAVEADPKSVGARNRLATHYLDMGRVDDAEKTYVALAGVAKSEGAVALAELYAETGRAERAIEVLRAAWTADPGASGVRDRLFEQLLRSGNAAEVSAEAKKLLEKDPRSVAGRYFAARVQLDAGRVEEALPALEEVAKIAPSPRALLAVGTAHAMRGDLDTAERYFLDAAKAGPGFGEPLMALTRLHLTRGANEKAVAAARAGLAANPRSSPAALQLAEALERSGERDKARELLEALARAVPKEPLFRVRLATLARASDDPAGARKHLEAALQLRPGFAAAALQLVDLLVAQKKLPEARQRIQKELEAAPKELHLHALLGRLWELAKDDAQAEAAYKMALNDPTSGAGAALQLAALYGRTGKTDRAIAELEAAVEKDPRFIPGLFALGALEEQRGQLPKARARYEATLKVDPTAPEAANNLACILADQGQELDRALELARVAKKGRPEDPNTLDTLGWVLFKKGTYDGALGELREAAEKLPKSALVQFHYGMALLKTGDKDGARKALAESLKLEAGHPGAAEAKRELAGI